MEPLTDQELDDIELVIRTHAELKKLDVPGISQRDNSVVLRLVAEVRRLRAEVDWRRAAMEQSRQP